MSGPKRAPFPGYTPTSLRLALRKTANEDTCITPLEGGFSIEGDELRIGSDIYELQKVEGDGDCAFHSMIYILHSVVNKKPWKGEEDAYVTTGVDHAGHLRRAFDRYREQMPRDGTWGDEIDWLLFSAMFGVTVNIISYNVLAEGFGEAMHSVIRPCSFGAKVHIPYFVEYDEGGVDAGLNAYVCNHYNTHYDPMRMVSRV